MIVEVQNFMKMTDHFLKESMENTSNRVNVECDNNV